MHCRTIVLNTPVAPIQAEGVTAYKRKMFDRIQNSLNSIRPEYQNRIRKWMIKEGPLQRSSSLLACTSTHFLSFHSESVIMICGKTCSSRSAVSPEAGQLRVFRRLGLVDIRLATEAYRHSPKPTNKASSEAHPPLGRIDLGAGLLRMLGRQ